MHAVLGRAAATLPRHAAPRLLPEDAALPGREGREHHDGAHGLEELARGRAAGDGGRAPQLEEAGQAEAVGDPTGRAGGGEELVQGEGGDGGEEVERGRVVAAGGRRAEGGVDGGEGGGVAGVAGEEERRRRGGGCGVGEGEVGGGEGEEGGGC